MSKTRKYLNVGAAALLALLAWIWLESRALSPWAQDRFVEALEERFDSTVEIDRLELLLFPTFRAVGSGVVFRHQGRADVPPLFEIDRFTASSSWLSLLFRRVSMLELQGLRIAVPRDRDEDSAAARDDGDGRDLSGGPGFVISTIVADGAHLEILPKEEWKQPLTFDLFQLTIRQAGPESAMTFDSVMTNPKPPGEILTSGAFGPWRKDRPRSTPVSGDYRFTDADLSVFDGIAGALSSEGRYRGVLERIEVEGWTDVPDFKATGNPVHLKTSFRAVVDGTSGDTYLEPVNATFLQSNVTARGRVAGVRGQKGKAVVLDVTVTEARVEDMVAIAVPLAGEPPLTGPIQFTATFHLPPGDGDVIQKLELEGQFGVEGSTFSRGAQEKVDSLSRRALGKPESPAQGAAADFAGQFQMANAAIAFPRVEFTIPGAAVRLSGRYGFRDEKLDFEGHLLMDAKVSETVTGAPSFFLKLVDPFFRDKGRTSIPVKVRGTIKEPDFGLAIGGARKVGEAPK